jgi:hypothetical protein
VPLIAGSSIIRNAEDVDGQTALEQINFNSHQELDLPNNEAEHSGHLDGGGDAQENVTQDPSLESPNSLAALSSEVIPIEAIPKPDSSYRSFDIISKQVDIDLHEAAEPGWCM